MGEGVSRVGRPTSEVRNSLLGEDLSKRYRDIKAIYQTLAADLEVARARLADRGVPVAFLVQNALAGAHREFLKLRRDVVAKLMPHHDGPIETQRLLGLSDLEELIASISGHAGEVAPEVPVIEPVVSVPAKPIPIPIAPLDISAAPDPRKALRFVDEPPPARTAPPARTQAIPTKSEALAPESLISLWSDEILTPRRDAPKVEYLTPVPKAPPIVPLPAVDSPVAPVPIPLTQPTGASHDVGAMLSRAEDTIERILRIKVKPGKVLPEWEEALIAARALKRKVLTESDSKLSPETLALAKGEHPLAALLMLIEQTGQLGDAEWAELHANVEDGLGKPIAMAAARHRFILEE